MSNSVPTQMPPKSNAGDCGCNKSEAKNTDRENPFDTGVTAFGAGANLYGAFSIENFCDAGPLSLTHEDAGGFLEYVRQFNEPNFWYQDGGVRVWAYYEDFDNWDDTYGMDAVKVAYHSGHGGMDGNGIFYVPMGSAWAGNDCTATSNNMRLGNEHAKYIFWSTCLSCRVLDGHSPIRTWQAANQGFRMLFGFETVSIDSGDYGKFFWEEWRAGKSLSQAWLDASWRIAHNQAPSATAVGANAEEAAAVLNNERLFSGVTPSTNWWQWRWYSAASAVRKPLLALPNQTLVGTLRPSLVDAETVKKVARQFEVELPQKAAAAASGSSFAFASGNSQFSIKANGAIDVQLAKSDYSSRNSLSMASARAKAEDAIQRYGIASGTSLELDRVLHSYEAGGTDQGSGQRNPARITSTVMQYRQMINGVPVIGPDAGAVRVTIDNNGAVTNLHSSIRTVATLSEKGRQSMPTPKPPGTGHGEIGPEPMNYESALAAQFSKRVANWAASGQMPLGYAAVPDTTEIGYDFINGEAVLVARRQVEVDFGNGYRKRYWTSVPIA
jgi:hypothetical protein